MLKNKQSTKGPFKSDVKDETECAALTSLDRAFCKIFDCKELLLCIKLDSTNNDTSEDLSKRRGTKKRSAK